MTQVKSHTFKALTSALSATVGLGNIAGVAVAVATGGPGAVFWMIILGLFGMSSKFHECTLAQIYRKVDDDGTIHGGPMYYLEMGLKERGLPSFVAKAFGVAVFALFCIGGSFGGGNMFQANQAWGITKTTLESRFGMVFDGNESMYFGIMMAILVGLVIIGGIKRIGSVTEKIIPIICVVFMSSRVSSSSEQMHQSSRCSRTHLLESLLFRSGHRWFRGYCDSRHQTSGVLK